MKKLIIATLLTLGLLTTASAHEYNVGKLTIDHPYVRSTPPMAPVAGGFMTITNNGDKDDRLFAGTAPFSKALEIHEMVMGDKGVMRMQQIEGGIVIPAGETVELKPGGLHIMFIGLDKQMIPDERHKSLLKFENAGDVEVEFVVKDITKMPETKMDHNKMNHDTMEAHMNHGEMSHDKMTDMKEPVKHDEKMKSNEKKDAHAHH